MITLPQRHHSSSPFSTSVCIKFSDFFEIDPHALDEYGAFDVTLVADAPVFIDPFCLYASNDDEYRKQHAYIIKYLCFLKELCVHQQYLDHGIIDRYFRFPEVKQLYMGFSKTGNRGRGLGTSFANLLCEAFKGSLASFGEETISETSHLEKLCVVMSGIGCDFISDFTANLLKDFLLTYTQAFAQRHLKREQCGMICESKAYFDFELKDWRSKKYYLPKFNRDYVLLVPSDILTRDDTWISHRGLIEGLQQLPLTIGNVALRQRLEELLCSVNLGYKRPTAKERQLLFSRFIQDNLEVVDWYIKRQEERKHEALSRAAKLVTDTSKWIANETGRVACFLDKTGFYSNEVRSIDEARARIRHFKQFVEDNDGYKLFFDESGKKRREVYVQLAFKLLWYASKRDANREVNNGQGPADFVISFGSGDKCVIEIKWASNRHLMSNLICQVIKYAKANGTENQISIVLYTNEKERHAAQKAINENHLALNKDVFLIDASRNRKSASRLDFQDIDFSDVEFPAVEMPNFN